MEDLAIEHLKSGLSINTHFGCPLKCKYCVLSTIEGHSGRPQKCIELDELKERMKSTNLYYINGKTPIYINNRTDPFLPEVIDSTYRVLEFLCDIGIKSPIMLITKIKPDSRIIPFMVKLNIMFFYTYSGLPKGIDYNSNSIIHEMNMEAILKYIPKKNRFLYLRPVLPNLNDNPIILENVLKNVGTHFDSIVMGGIRILDNNKQIIEDLCGINLKEFDSHHKLFDAKLYQLLLKYQSIYKINILRHTSCAIANFLKEKNKISYFGKKDHCDESCNNYSNCYKGGNSKDDSTIKNEIKYYCDKFGYDVNEFRNDYQIYIEGRVSQEFIAAIKCAFGYEIIADSVELSPSERIFVNN
jgi:DNA repair photolyase